jgi:hypothetical protein
MTLIEMFQKEDWATANLVTTEAVDVSDILNAREFILRALDDISEKNTYFDFLKYLRKTHGKDYSTEVHRKAAELIKQR